MIELLFDCDLTMGLPGRDVDDGLALLYLLGSPGVRLAGITGSFGNSTIQEVHRCLLRTVEELGLRGLPVHRGASGPPRPGGRTVRPAARADGPEPEAEDGSGAEAASPAARFLAETVAARPGRYALLATGSLTNLADAARLDPGFFAGLKKIVVMGGVTGPLLLGGRMLGELNFSVDPRAARAVLRSGARVTVVTGNLCLPLLFERTRFDGLLRELRGRSGPRSGRAAAFAEYLQRKLVPWFQHIRRQYGLEGFHAWDLTAAIHLTHPQLFDRARWSPNCAPQDLASGLLRPAEAGSGMEVEIPSQLLEAEAYWALLRSSLLRFARRFRPRLSRASRGRAAGPIG